MTKTGSDEEELLDVPMAPSTRLKYSRIQGGGSQDADDWLCKFKSIATANQEDLESTRQIFQGILKGKALKWYQDLPDGIRDSWADFVHLFLKIFWEAGGEVRALGQLSLMTKKFVESVQKYSERVKALIQKLTTDITQSVINPKSPLFRASQSEWLFEIDM